MLSWKIGFVCYKGKRRRCQGLQGIPAPVINLSIANFALRAVLLANAGGGGWTQHSAPFAFYGVGANPDAKDAASVGGAPCVQPLLLLVLPARAAAVSVALWDRRPAWIRRPAASVVRLANGAAVAPARPLALGAFWPTPPSGDPICGWLNLGPYPFNALSAQYRVNDNTC